MENRGGGICARLAEVRQKHFGRRGKARFARELGIRPSTYDHYEKDRIAPAPLLVLAARLTGTNLEWLLTGDGPREAPPTREETSSETEQLVERLRRILTRRPELNRQVRDYLQLLEGAAEHGASPATSSAAVDMEELIPVVGGTAAGPARFWREIDEARGRHAPDERLETLLREQGRRAMHAADTVPGTPDSGQLQHVSLIQFSHPDELGFVEFLTCPAAKAKYPEAVAWRIDGESMAPRYPDRALVITSPQEPAAEGHPCVARQKGQIGVNCKIFHRDGDEVVLIPVNESFPAQRFPAAELLWAHRVLFSVRLIR